MNNPLFVISALRFSGKCDSNITDLRRKKKQDKNA